MYRHFGSRKRRASSSATTIPSSVGAAKCVPSAARSRIGRGDRRVRVPLRHRAEAVVEVDVLVAVDVPDPLALAALEVDRPRVAQLVRRGDAAGERLPRALAHRPGRAASARSAAAPSRSISSRIAAAVDLDGGADGRHRLLGRDDQHRDRRPLDEPEHDRAEDRARDRVLTDRPDHDRARTDLLRDLDQRVRRLAGDEPRLDLDAGSLEVGDGAPTADARRSSSASLDAPVPEDRRGG